VTFEFEMPGGNIVLCGYLAFATSGGKRSLIIFFDPLLVTAS